MDQAREHIRGYLEEQMRRRIPDLHTIASDPESVEDQPYERHILIERLSNPRSHDAELAAASTAREIFGADPGDRRS